MATPEIRAAASLVLVWQDRVLMGQRGSGAAFMPSKFVFPGGGVDATDAGGGGLGPACLAAVARGSPVPAGALVACARRELTEETGLQLAEDAGLRFIFRAITPMGAPRRFDARFFLASAADVLGDPSDLGRAGSELSGLAWVPLDRARGLDLPFITEIVLAETRALLAGGRQEGVPFFDNSGPDPLFRRL